MKIGEYEQMMAYLMRPATGDREKFQKGSRAGISSKPLTKEKFTELYENFLKSKMGVTKKYESIVSVVRPLKELLDEVGTDAKNAGIDIQLRKSALV